MNRKTVNCVVPLAFAMCGVSSAALVNHWTFDESTGLSAADSVGLADGTWQNATSTGLSWGSGQIGGAAILTGDNGSDRVFDVGTIGINGATSITMSVWIRPELSQNVAATGIFTGRNSSINRGTSTFNGQFWGLGWEEFNGDDRRVRADSTGATRSPAVYDGTEVAPEWIHVAFTWEGDGPIDPSSTNDPTAVYINGVATAGLVNADLYNSGSSWLIGGDPLAGTNRNFGGAIDDLAVWDEALSEAEILSIYNNGLNGIAVPEPSVALLGGFGLIGLFRRRRA